MSAPDDWCPECEGTGRELIEGGGTNPCPFGCTPPKPIPGSTACPKCHGSGQVGDEVCPLGCPHAPGAARAESRREVTPGLETDAGTVRYRVTERGPYAVAIAVFLEAEWRRDYEPAGKSRLDMHNNYVVEAMFAQRALCLVPLVTPAMLAKLDVVEAQLERVRARVEQMRAIRAERAEA